MEVKEKRIEGAVYYGQDGKSLEEFEDAVAYHTAKSHYVRELKARLYVKGTIVKRDDKDRYKWRKVGPICYKNYLKYLTTNQEYCYNLADRNRND